MLFQCSETHGNFLPVRCRGWVSLAHESRLFTSLFNSASSDNSWELGILHDGAIYRTELANPTNRDFWFSGEPVVKHLPTLDCFQLNTKVHHVLVANQQVSGLIIQSVSLFLILFKGVHNIWWKYLCTPTNNALWGLPSQRTVRNSREILS